MDRIKSRTRLGAIAVSSLGGVLVCSGLAIGTCYFLKSAQVLVRDCYISCPTVWSSVAFSHDGERVAAKEPSGRMRCWNLSTGKEVAAEFGQADSLSDIQRYALSPDGQFVARCNDMECYINHTTAELIVENVSTDSTYRELEGLQHEVHSVGWSPDGRRLAAGGCHDVVVWDVETAEEIARFPADTISWQMFTFVTYCWIGLFLSVWALRRRSQSASSESRFLGALADSDWGAEVA